jgi:hypothetical protein
VGLIKLIGQKLDVRRNRRQLEAAVRRSISYENEEAGR